MNAIEVQHLSKFYGKVRALNDISFTISAGERFGFLGPNGAGKTTAMRCLLGLLRYSEGQIILFNEKITPHRSIALRNRIGYIPGELGLYSEMTGENLIRYIGEIYNFPLNWADIRGIAHRLEVNLKKKIKTLSKGNKQKIGCLLALMHDFDLLLLDEPTSGLDPLIQREFFTLLKEKQAQTGCTVFLSSHILAEVEAFCDRVAIIRHGQIIEIASIQSLKEKNLKHLEISFPSETAVDAFQLYLKQKKSDQYIENIHHQHITFLLPPIKIREMVIDLYSQTWAGMAVDDITISASSLEQIFMKYYTEEQNHGNSK